MTPSRKIVVTGALGHIGSRLIRDLPAALGDIVVVMLDNLSTQRYASLFDLPQKGRYRFVETDVLECELPRLLDGAEVVFHLAAITDAAGSFAIREKVEQTNYCLTQRVAEACVKTGTSMCFASSTSVYGTQQKTVNEDCPTCDLRPQSPYAQTKLREEDLLASMGQQQDLKYVVCRFGTIFGSSPGMRFHTAVNKFCWQAVMGQPLTVWPTALRQKRPYLDLDDAVRAMIHIVQKQLFDCSLYNVLTANRTVNDIIEIIKGHVPDVEISFVNSPIMNQLSYEVLNKRFVATGFTFRGSLARGIEQTISLLRASASAEHHGPCRLSRRPERAKQPD